MRVHPPTPRHRREAGFTLIELLVVIVIIGVLVGLSLPVFGSIQNKARRVQATNDMRNVKIAMISYYTDYRKYPLSQVQLDAAAGGRGDTVYGDPAGTYSSADLFNILRAVDSGSNQGNQPNPMNPNKTVYWDGQMVKDPNRPRSGITYKDFQSGGNTVKAGSFVDPWGNPYIIWIDADNDGDLSILINGFYRDIKRPDQNADGIGDVHPGQAPMGVAFASLGPDGQLGTKDHRLQGSDDIVSW